VFAQSFKLVVAQGSDGTLYVVTDHGRFTLIPVPIADDEINASADLGTIDSSQMALAMPTAAPLLPTATPIPPTATPVPSATTATTTPFAPVTLSGHGEINTRPFHLVDGNYTSDWTVSGHCFHAARLTAVDGRRLREDALSPAEVFDGSRTGQTQLYNVPAGDYYAALNDSGCDWTINISSLK
jgi:hypothetical protein